MSYTPTDKKQHWLNVLFTPRVLLPGVEGVILPSGQTFERPTAPCDGTMRFNTQIRAFEGYYDGLWRQFPIGTVAGEANTASNVGPGNGLFRNKVGVNLEFKTIVAGANINITNNADNLTIDALSAGEANDGINIGGFAEVFESKVGVDLRFRTLRSNVPGALSITQNAGDITFDLIGAPYLSLAGGTMTGDINFGPAARILGDGTALATAPMYSFNSDPDTGLFSHSPDQLGWAAGGNTVFFNRSNGVMAVDTGAYETLLSSPQDIPNKAYVDNAFAALPDFVEVAGDTMTGSLSMTGAARFLGNIAGTAALPSYAFDTLADTGIFPDGTGLGFSTTGGHRWSITGGGAGGDLIPAFGSQFDIGSMTLPVDNVYSNRFLSDDGAAATPSHSFWNDDTTGVFLNGAGNLAFSSAGAHRWSITSAGAISPALANTYDVGTTGSRVLSVFTNKVSATAGSGALPAYYFDLDFNTGMWSPAPDTIGFATAGLDRMQIQDNGLIHAETALYENLVVAGDDNSIPNKKYVNDQITGAVPTELNDLTDVIITAPAINSYLRYNGAHWVNVPRITQINDADDDSYVNVDFGGSDSDTVRIQAGVNPNATGGSISIETLGAVTPNYAGGDINVTVGDGSDNNGGSFNLRTGDVVYTSVGGNGGDINITGGDGYGPSGASAFSGGNVTIQGGTGAGVDTTGGTVKLVAGNGRGPNNGGGDVILEAGNHDTGTDIGEVILTPGTPTGGGISAPVILRSKALSTKAVELRFEEGGTTDYIGLKAPDSVTTSRTWVLPTDDPVSVAGDFLTTDASGNWSFAAPPSASYRRSFVNADLVGNILTVSHNLGEKYVHATVWSDLDRIMIPDITMAVDSNTLTLDLSSFTPLPGTWNIVVTA